MMNFSFLMSMFLFLISISSLISRYKHILSMLLSLEMMMLSIFVLLISMLQLKNLENSIIMTFICLIVCEGTLGLAMLISMSRSTGNTLISSTNLL